MGKKIWINTAEPSGDMHGALLLNALRAQAPDCSFVGMGGPQLRDAGLTAFARAEELSVMGVTEVLGHLPKIYFLLQRIKKKMAQEKPDAVIVIDAPDFHFQVIRAARRLKIPVYYYISPKIWAWRSDRGWFIKNNVRRVLSILPFEEQFYRQFTMQVDYVGNPLVDLIDFPSIAAEQLQKGLIGLLPGSRKKEISALLPEFAQAARIVYASVPDVRFSVVRAPNVSLDYLKRFWPQDVPVTFIAPENRWRFMRQCEMLIAASGTVTLESALVGTPTIATYKISKVSYAVGKALVKVPYMSLANIILDTELFPELLQEQCDGAPLAKKAMEWLDPHHGPQRLAYVREQLDVLRKMMGEKGAPGRAAQLILGDLGA